MLGHLGWNWPAEVLSPAPPRRSVGTCIEGPAHSLTPTSVLLGGLGPRLCVSLVIGGEDMQLPASGPRARSVLSLVEKNLWAPWVLPALPSVGFFDLCPGPGPVTACPGMGEKGRQAAVRRSVFHELGGVACWARLCQEEPEACWEAQGTSRGTKCASGASSHRVPGVCCVTC